LDYLVPTKERSPIARRLKEARTAAGMSQKTLGIKAGIDPFSASPRMNQYETQKHVPDYSTVERIAKVLDLPTVYFYCEDDNLARVIKQWNKRSAAEQKQLGDTPLPPASLKT